MSERIRSFQSKRSLNTYLKSVLILIVGFSLTPSLAQASCSYPDDPVLEQERQQCLNREAHTTWDCSQQRCVVPETSGDQRPLELRNDFLECKEKEKRKDRRDCYLEIAKEHTASGRTSDVDESLEDEEELSLMINIAYTSMMVIGRIVDINSIESGTTKKFFETGNLCPSRTALGITSTVGLIWDAKLKYENRKKLEDLVDEYEKSARHENPFKAQSNALKALKKKEEELKDFAKERKRLHEFMIAGYGIAAALATAELISLRGTGSFGTDCEYDIKNKEEREELAKQADDSEGGVGGFISNSVENTGEFLSAPFESIGKFLRLKHPGNVITVSLAGAYFNDYLRDKAKEQYDDSSDNVTYLKAVIATFEDSVAGFCPDGRNNMNNPECYCYTNSGERNENRTESDICQNFWAQKEYELNLASNDYNVQGDSERKGCIFANGEYDPDCECLNMVDRQNNNACYKVPSHLTHQMGGLGESVGIQSFAEDVENLSSGFGPAQTLDENDLSRRAARVREVQDQLLDNLNNTRKKEGLEPVELDEGKIAQDILNRDFREGVGSSAASLTSNPLSAPSSNLDSNSLSDEQLTTESESVGLSGGSGLGAGTRKNDKNDSFNLSSSGRSSAGRVDEFKKKNYRYENDDIVSNQGASIWRILSHRYSESGLRRLFPDEDH